MYNQQLGLHAFSKDRGSVCVCVLERERELHVNKSTYGEALKCNWRFNEEKIRCSQIAMPIGGVCDMTKCVVNTAPCVEWGHCTHASTSGPTKCYPHMDSIAVKPNVALHQLNTQLARFLFI